jgi:hypothetical protein
MNQISGWVWVTRGMKLKPAQTPAKLSIGCGLHPRVKICTRTCTHRVGYPLGFEFTD